MMKRMTVFVLVLLAVLGFTGYAAAYSPNLEDRPEAFDPGRSTGFFIWQDRDGLHLRTSTDGSRHVFSGTIRTDGVFRDTFGKSKGGDDFFRVSGDRSKVTFQFTNLGDTAAIDMFIDGGSYVAFNLSLDGAESDPAAIFIGREGWHPGDYKFTLQQETEQVRYVPSRTVIIVGHNYWWHRGHHGYYRGHWHRTWHRPWHRPWHHR